MLAYRRYENETPKPHCSQKAMMQTIVVLSLLSSHPLIILSVSLSALFSAFPFFHIILFQSQLLPGVCRLFQIHNRLQAYGISTVGLYYSTVSKESRLESSLVESQTTAISAGHCNLSIQAILDYRQGHHPCTLACDLHYVSFPSVIDIIKA